MNTIPHENVQSRHSRVFFLTGIVVFGILIYSYCTETASTRGLEFRLREVEMSIRVKTILIVLPLLVVTLIIAGTSSYFIATTGITRVTVEFFDFKTAELERHIESQWQLLVENEFSDRPEMVRAAQAGIEVYAQGTIRSESEVIFAVNSDGEIVLATSDIEPTPEETPILQRRAALGERDLATLPIGGIDRVTMGFPFEPFGWYVLVTDERDAFYSDVDRITYQTLYLVLIASIVSTVLLLVFVRYITGPLMRVVGAMKRIITENDLSARVGIAYRDEIGEMSNTFNIMIGELDRAYGRIKQYAFEAVLAQKRESKIRRIFQKYVPQDLIDRFFANPESMLIGENRELSILFSDIRSFTTISEAMAPDDLVNSLNRYFSIMVDIIMNRNGIIDKYIGDAIMAFFGAPVHHDDDCLQSVYAGIEMSDAVARFNEDQVRLGKPEFHIGIGISFGEVTVGNIGTERKMDYTVIGDMVNLASRLEGLTKVYKQPLLFSETVHERITNDVPCRLLDSVAVKGKTKGVRIFTARQSLTPEIEKAWKVHNAAMELYYARSFSEAAREFEQVGKMLGEDFASEMMKQRCVEYADSPPPENWDGVEVMKSK